MKKNVLLFLVCLFSLTVSFGQNPPAACSELFISEYSHGKYNNRSMEIYNPTNAVISLAGYKLARNDNGGAGWHITDFPTGATIQPFKTYVVICDKRDTTQYRVGLEYPIFDGYERWDTCRTNGVPQRDPVTGRVYFCVQVDTLNGNLPLRGTRYNDFLDLKCRATGVNGAGGGWLNPVYNVNRTFYFSGNDAMGLFKGTPDLTGFTNLVDIVGVYNDPGMTPSAASWKDWLGRSVSEEVTLVRKRNIKNGTGLVAYSRRDTFKYGDYLIFTNNNASPSFQNLGSHTCDCEATPPVSARRTCNGTVITSSNEIPAAEFKIYPNPTSSRNISIEADGIIRSITVYDLMGRVVEKPNVAIGSESVNLTLSNLSSGIFMVKVQTDDNRIGVRKLVVH